MSTSYFLDCKRCGEAVHITDNKLNSPIEKESVRVFLIYHGYGTQCQVVLESEHTIEFEHVEKFREFFRTLNAKGKNHGKTKKD